MRVLKYALSAGSPVTELRMPARAEIMTFGVQDERLYVWALVDERKPTTHRYVEVFPTGGDREVPAQATFLGTVFVGEMVWHAFEVEP